jgi:hypothetical protein
MRIGLQAIHSRPENGDARFSPLLALGLPLRLFITTGEEERV